MVVGAILLVRDRMAEVRTALRDPETLRSMVISAVLLAANWLIYRLGGRNGTGARGELRLLHQSAGQRGHRHGAPGRAAEALAVGRHRRRVLSPSWYRRSASAACPMIAVSLALTFRASTDISARPPRSARQRGLFVETLVLVPLALVLSRLHLHARWGRRAPRRPVPLGAAGATGPATAMPLLLFAYAVQRLQAHDDRHAAIPRAIDQPSSSRSPSSAKRSTPTRLLSFGLIWLSLAIYSANSFARRGRAMG